MLMEFRQLARCAYQTATRASSTLPVNGVRRCQAKPSPLLSLIPSYARQVSNSSNNQAPPRSLDGHSHGHSSPASPTGRSTRAATPPRPPTVKSPWASRESTPSATPAPPPDTLLKDSAELPGLIRWDVNAFLQRNHMRSGPPPEMRLRPSTGRTVYKTGNVDVARCFQLLNRVVKVNRVKQDAQRQRFHERGGLKRKRLRSERWRRRFKHGFCAVVNRVTELRNQGW